MTKACVVGVATTMPATTSTLVEAYETRDVMRSGVIDTLGDRTSTPAGADV